MKITPYLLLTITGLVLSACDSKEEKLRKEALENKADSLEDAASKAKKDGERNAKAEKIEAERKAEALKKEAERTRDLK